jgi:hypothetical protein
MTNDIRSRASYESIRTNCFNSIEKCCLPLMRMTGATTGECEHAGKSLGKRMTHLRRVLIHPRCSSMLDTISKCADRRNDLSHDLNTAIIWGRQREALEVAQIAFDFFHLFCSNIPQSALSARFTSDDWKRLKDPMNISKPQIELEVYNIMSLYVFFICALSTHSLINLLDELFRTI